MVVFLLIVIQVYVSKEFVEDFFAYEDVKEAISESCREDKVKFLNDLYLGSVVVFNTNYLLKFFYLIILMVFLSLFVEKQNYLRFYLFLFLMGMTATILFTFLP